jgi:hypothetical protein
MLAAQANLPRLSPRPLTRREEAMRAELESLFRNLADGLLAMREVRSPHSAANLN